MVQIIDEATLRRAYRGKLNSLFTNVNNQSLVEESYNYRSATPNINFSVALRGNVADSFKYMRSVIDLNQHCTLITEGLATSESSIKNIFDGVKHSINDFSNFKKDLEREVYLNSKRLRVDTAFYERFQSFQQEDLRNTNTLKHPGLIDYYFNKDSLCTVENGLISLPKLNTINLNLKEVFVARQYSTFGTSKDDANTIKEEYTKHEYICRHETPLPNGATLTYGIRLNREMAFNKIEIVDSSINYCTVSRLFTDNDDIDFVGEQKGRKKILYINEPEAIEGDIIYISFNQSKYVDVASKPNSLRNQLVTGSNSSFELDDSLTTGYIYEFNIDSIVVQLNEYQDTGLFRLNDSIDTSSLSLMRISWAGHFIDSFKTIKAFIEGEYQEGNLTSTEVKEVTNYSKESVSKYSKVSLLFILETDSKYSGYIKTIDIEAA